MSHFSGQIVYFHLQIVRCSFPPWPNACVNSSLDRQIFRSRKLRKLPDADPQSQHRRGVCVSEEFRCCFTFNKRSSCVLMPLILSKPGKDPCVDFNISLRFSTSIDKALNGASEAHGRTLSCQIILGRLSMHLSPCSCQCG